MRKRSVSFRCAETKCQHVHYMGPLVVIPDGQVECYFTEQSIMSDFNLSTLTNCFSVHAFKGNTWILMQLFGCTLRTKCKILWKHWFCFLKHFLPFNYSEQWCPAWCHSPGRSPGAAVGELRWLRDHPSSQRMGLPHSGNHAVQQTGLQLSIFWSS